MIKWLKYQFSAEATERREQRLQERKAAIQAQKDAREEARQAEAAAAQAAEEHAQRVRERILAAEERRQREKEAMRDAILDILAAGKVPDLGLQVEVPFTLQKTERWILAAGNVEYAEMKVQRREKVLIPWGDGLFAVSTKHVFFNGERSFRIPHGKIVSVQNTPLRGLEVVRDRAGGLPEYFGIGGDDARFVSSLIRLLHNTDFGRGEPEIQSVEEYMAARNLPE